MLNWTGDPYVDIGAATLAAMAHKRDPTLLTPADLDKASAWIEDNYTRDPLKSFLTVAFTSNAWFSQDAYNPDKPGLSDEKRRERLSKRSQWAERHLRAWKRTPQADSGLRCVFTGKPVFVESLSNKLAPGKGGRAQIPLVQGDEDINFYAYGDSGLPVSGEALLCLQAFPLGCAKVSGRLLAVHCSDPALTLAFAERFWRENRKGAQEAQQAGSTKLPETHFTLGTLLASTLVSITEEYSDYADETGPGASITAYHLTNGQQPSVDIYHLPLGVTRFLLRANSARYRKQWQEIVNLAWQRAPKKKSGRKGEAAGADEPFTARRNYLYDDLLRLPDQATRFMRIYLLRRVDRRLRLLEDDPRSDYSTQREIGLVSWDLTELFLKEVFNMDETRIAAIRRLGDRLADYVAAENDRRFFRAFFGEMNYSLFRNRLIKADIEAVRRGGEPLITFDQFVEVFEEGEEIARRDWRLARDLALIRMIERLRENGWLSAHADALPEVTEPEEAGEDETDSEN
ncbi:MAG: type I-B CRISPR-associated protein Cas8b1/Cst1 [Aggregatilineales bacterium]